MREVEDFYLNIPPMADLELLWDRIERYQPIVLTGVPKEIAEAPANKRAWVSKYLGSKVQVRCCEASEKWRHAQRGDILIDDSVKHRKRWVKAGGIWVTHRSAEGPLRYSTLWGCEKHGPELRGKVGDGVNQAADLISATASIPSLNFIPLTTFGNWF